MLLLGVVGFLLIFPVTSPEVGRGGLREGSLPRVVLNTAWLQAAGEGRGHGAAGREQQSHAGSDGDVGASAQG